MAFRAALAVLAEAADVQTGLTHAQPSRPRTESRISPELLLFSAILDHLWIQAATESHVDPPSPPKTPAPLSALQQNLNF